MTDALEFRRLRPIDLPAYKLLRDASLLAHPEAFSSDAATESLRSPDSYVSRLGIDRHDGGEFLIGAFEGDRLIGAIGCEREWRIKARHVAHIVGLMVDEDRHGIGLGRALLAQCVAYARRAEGLKMLTLTVTATNVSAIELYETAGFVRCGSLPDAICVDGHFYAKNQMALML